MFSPEDIQNRIRQRPFVPLRIVTSSGQAFDIYHPDLILVGRREIVIGRSSTENPAHFDQLTRLALMHVTALEDLPLPTPAGGDGQQ